MKVVEPKLQNVAVSSKLDEVYEEENQNLLAEIATPLSTNLQ